MVFKVMELNASRRRVWIGNSRNPIPAPLDACRLEVWKRRIREGGTKKQLCQVRKSVISEAK